VKQLAIVLCMLMVCGCHGRNEAKPADVSDTPREAVEKGAPSVENSWGPEDYAAFAGYLSKLTRDSYPRFNSTRSKALFMKLVDSVEQPIFASNEVPFNRRMELALQMIDGANTALKTYCAAHNSGIDYSTELMYLQGLVLSVTRQFLVLVDEFIPTIDPNDGKYEVRMQGLRQLKRGIAEELSGAIVSMQETKAYSDSQRLILAKYLAREATAILHHLDQDARQELEGKVKEMKSVEKDNGIRELLSVITDKFEQNTTGDAQATK